jgi:hypothetical protein
VFDLHLRRLQAARDVGGTLVEGRAIRLVEHRYKGRVVARALIASGGPHSPRIDVAMYRSGSERTFEIHPIVIRPESAADRVGKQLGLNVEAALGRPSLDDAFSFETATKPDLVRELFSDPTLCAVLAEAMEAFDAVVIGPPKGTVAGLVSRSPERLTSSDERRLSVLVRLSGALPAMRVRPPKSLFSQVMPVIVGAIVVEGSMFGAIAATLAADPIGGPVVVGPAAAGVALALLFACTVLLLLFRGMSNGFRPWLVTSLAALPVVSAVSVALYNQLNEALDADAPRTYEAAVFEYRPKRGKQSGVLRVRGLPARIVEPDARGLQSIGSKFMPGATCKRVAFTIGNGRFDSPWVIRTRCVSS